MFVHCFWLFCFFVSALRVFRAVTRLTVYRALSIFEISSAPDLENFSILFFVFLNIRSVEFDKFHFFLHFELLEVWFLSD